MVIGLSLGGVVKMWDTSSESLLYEDCGYALIGARTRVQSHAFICELVTIGEDCFVGHGVMFVNDTFSTGGPARGNRELWRETVIGDRVSIGSNATIMPVRIADDVVIGAGAVVTRDITTSGTYAGNPARRLLADK